VSKEIKQEEIESVTYAQKREEGEGHVKRPRSENNPKIIFQDVSK
jgi:hypothetical protein